MNSNLIEYLNNEIGYYPGKKDWRTTLLATIFTGNDILDIYLK